MFNQKSYQFNHFLKFCLIYFFPIIYLENYFPTKIQLFLLFTHLHFGKNSQKNNRKYLVQES